MYPVLYQVPLVVLVKLDFVVTLAKKLAYPPPPPFSTPPPLVLQPSDASTQACSYDEAPPFDKNHSQPRIPKLRVSALCRTSVSRVCLVAAAWQRGAPARTE